MVYDFRSEQRPVFLNIPDQNRSLLTRSLMSYGQSGFTLLELLISLALSSVVILAAASLVTEVTSSHFQVMKEAEVSESISLFQLTLQNHVEAATQVFCNCSGPASSGDSQKAQCQYTAPSSVSGTSVISEDICDQGRQSGPGCVPGVPLVAFTLVSESSLAPMDSTSGSDCYVPAAWSGAALTKASHRGCKRVYQFQYTRPTQETATTLGAPGELKIVDVTNYFQGLGSLTDQVFIPQSGTVVQKIGYVSSFRCGFSSTRHEFEVFTRLRIYGKTPKSYHPSDASFLSGAAHGIDRYLQSSFELSSIYTPGLIKSFSQTQKCKDNGASASDWTECCSQILVGGICQDISVGTTSGQSSDQNQCQSHMIDSMGRCV